MKRTLPVLISILLTISTVLSTSPAVAAAPAPDPAAEPYSGASLCLPDPFPNLSSGCLPLGPSQFLGDLAKEGLILPLRPLPAGKPDPTLAVFGRKFVAIASNGSIPVYSTLEDAETRSSATSIAGGTGLHYLSYLSRVDNDRGIFYQLVSGVWINAGDATMASASAFSHFQGLAFTSTPSNEFGWVLSETKVKSGPGYNNPDTGRTLNREEIVQVYAQQKEGNANWLMIGINEWADDQYVGRVMPTSVPPTGVDNNRWIEVNLAEQTLSVYDSGQLIYATLIATGRKPLYTRPGLFQIKIKKDFETMSGVTTADKSDYYYLEDVPWTMYFDQARALHGAYWRTLYGYPASHGCVNLAPGDANWLYHWATVGDWVYVWDPTGETPTDPAYYGAGGA